MNAASRPTKFVFKEPNKLIAESRHITNMPIHNIIVITDLAAYDFTGSQAMRPTAEINSMIKVTNVTKIIKVTFFLELNFFFVFNLFSPFLYRNYSFFVTFLFYKYYISVPPDMIDIIIL